LIAQLGNLGFSFNLPAFSAELMAAIQASFNSIGLTLSGGLGPLAAQLGAVLNAGANGFIGAIQAGENLLGNLAGSFGAGLTGAIQTGESLAANFIAQLGELGFSLSGGLPAISAELMATISANLGAGVSGLISVAQTGFVQAGQALTALFGESVTGLINTGETLLGGLGSGVAGLVQTGQTLATIWGDATASVADTLRAALYESFGVGFPGLVQTGQSLTAGIEGALSGLGQTGGAIVTTLEDLGAGFAGDFEAGLHDLELALQAAFNINVSGHIAA